MLSRGRVLCQLAAVKQQTRDISQLSRLVQRAILTRNATSPASICALSHAYKLALTLSHRSYATAAATKPTKTVKRDVKKVAAKKKAPAKTKATTRKTTGTKKRATAKKTKKAKKAAPKKKPRVKKTISAEAKEKATIKELKKKALLEPTGLPSNAWTVLSVETSKANAKAGTGIAETVKVAAEKYRNLTPAEQEHYNHVANQNKAANDAAYKAWVQSHTAEEIRVANLARLNLRRRLAKKTATGRNKYPPHTQKIVDDRAPKKTGTAYSLFFSERRASGDLKNISVVDGSRLIASEWKSLSAGEKKKYQDTHAAEHEKYLRAYKSAFGHDVKKSPSPTA